MFIRQPSNFVTFPAFWYTWTSLRFAHFILEFFACFSREKNVAWIAVRKISLISESVCFLWYLKDGKMHKDSHQKILCNFSVWFFVTPMDCSTPGFLIPHYLWELAPTHVHWVSDTLQPSHPLLPSPPAFSLAQHQGLFQWGSSSHQVAEVLELQHQSFQWMFRTDFL